uniref:ATP synthase F0 subunit 8 n=1 Tax=Nilaparvata bakeri TaxID=1223488 RepID=A0A1L1VRR5_9HEMI|nr:ATP synthase F0 subunit 8 [Nilaparvata bakeri]AGE94098.1 ATP synthase F0 subunit 8 [Nilaparvata bakeri]
MPQMSPYSWMSILFMTNIMIKLIKMNLFFEKKL